MVKVLPRVNCSDHHPILIKIDGLSTPFANRPFRFESAWLTHSSFFELVRQKWNSNADCCTNLSILSHDLRSWNNNIFGHILKRKRCILARLDGIQRKITDKKRYNPFLDNLEMNLRKELDNVLVQEELLWHQKARTKWIKDGDRNTRFYHLKTITKRRCNKISMLRDTEGNWKDDPVVI